MIIREMEARDVMGVVGLIRNELGYDDISSDVYDRVIRIYNAENYVTFIAEDAGSVIGFVGVMRGLAFELDGEYIRVIALAVSREHMSSTATRATKKKATASSSACSPIRNSPMRTSFTLPFPQDSAEPTIMTQAGSTGTTMKMTKRPQMINIQ